MTKEERKQELEHLMEETKDMPTTFLAGSPKPKMTREERRKEFERLLKLSSELTETFLAGDPDAPLKWC